jgi:serine/threonine-protein phosphatase 2A regulatory subunit B'
MVVHVCTGLCQSWPWTSSTKQVLMLNVLEEVLELAGAEACAPVMPALALLISRCVGATHFQVAERALMLWQNQSLAAGLLGAPHAPTTLPLLYPPLCRLSAGHWNPSVLALAMAVLKHYEEVHSEAFGAAAARASGSGSASSSSSISSRRQAWTQLDQAAAAAMVLSVAGRGGVGAAALQGSR